MAAPFEPALPDKPIREILEGIHEETGRRFIVEEVARAFRNDTKNVIRLNQGKLRMATRLEKGFPNTTAEFWSAA